MKGAAKVLKRATVISLALVLFVALSATAGTTGKIAGRVTDGSGNPLVGATVMVVGTSYGAMTDSNGEYFIINLSPDTYNVQARMVGMSEKTAEGVSVITDQTTRMDFTLDPEAVGTTVIQVTDQRGMILRDVTSSVHVVGRDEIATMPVAGIADIVSRQAGAIDSGGLHMRGGRDGEVAYVVDGVSQVDPTSNSFNSDIPMSAVAETSIISGGFGAEYGNAQSGVVNIVTREGGSEYTGSVSANGNDWQALGFVDDWGWGRTTPWSESRINAEIAVGGPEPLTEILLPAIGLNVPGESRIFLSGEYREIGGGEEGRYGYGFNDWTTSYTANAKLTVRPNPMTKLNFTGYYMDRISGYGLWDWSRFETPYIDEDPESLTYGDTLADGRNILYGLPTRFWHNYSVGISLTQTFSDATFIEVKFNQYQAHFEYKIMNDPDATHPNNEHLNFDTEWMGEDWTMAEWLTYTPSRTRDTDGFYRAGASRYAWYDSKSTTTTFRTDITSQVNQENQFKAGIEGKYYDIFNYSVDTASGGNIYMGQYSAYPHAIGAYIQDKMEYRGMIVNAGLCFDYFDPNFDEYPADPTNPINPGTSPGDPDHIINPISVPVKYHLSPRIGFSHPITERDVFHFTYGHYFQMPEFSRLFDGAEFDLSGAFPIVGNPDLAPEETISYEVGVKHQFDDVTMVDVTGYYKDITGLVDMQKNFYSAVDAYDLFINGDYGNVRGVEVSLMKRPSNYWSASGNYSYSVAMGKSSSAYQNYSYNWAGWIIPKQESYLDWDQRHTVNVDLDFRYPQGEGPTLGGIRILEGFGTHVSWNYGSGFPYSEANQGTAAPSINGSRKPWTMTTTLKVNKKFWFGDTDINVWCQINNLFDRRNINYIADIAWYDADQDGDGEPDHDPEGSLHNPYVYSRPRMIRFGIDFEW